MKTADFSKPPSASDNCTLRANCKQIWDFPHPDSPTISVIPLIGKPLFVTLSRARHRNVICRHLVAKIDEYSSANEMNGKKRFIPVLNTRCICYCSLLESNLSWMLCIQNALKHWILPHRLPPQSIHMTPIPVLMSSTLFQRLSNALQNMIAIVVSQAICKPHFNSIVLLLWANMHRIFSGKSNESCDNSCPL